LIENGTDLTADLLKVGHHGSRHSTTMDFLFAVRPRVAILSAPCRATRGLPHPQVFKNLADQGIALYWTGREGAITVGPGDRMRERGGGESIPATGESFRAAAWARARHCPAGA
jgi:beta-lactamase superfamily II metal-dependent hydrolase